MLYFFEFFIVHYAFPIENQLYNFNCSYAVYAFFCKVKLFGEML